MDITTATMPSGSVYPAVAVGDGLLLTHPQLNEKRLGREYEQAVLRALEEEKNRHAVIAAANSGVQYMLSIGENWLAPMSVHLGKNGEVIALLHCF